MDKKGRDRVTRKTRERERRVTKGRRGRVWQSGCPATPWRNNDSTLGRLKYVTT